VGWAVQERSYTQHRVYGLVGMHPKTYRYASMWPDDAAIRARLQELAAVRRRFGYRHLHVLLRREGTVLNRKKLYGLCCEERLTVRKLGGRKRALGARTPMALPQGPNRRWSLDFVPDPLVHGRRFRILTVVDDFTRECLAAVSDTSLSGPRIIRELDLVAGRRGYPCLGVSDNGTELTLNAMLCWREQHVVAWHDIAPGRPMQNGLVESFNGRLYSTNGLLNREKIRRNTIQKHCVLHQHKAA
jgi:putative transposase